MNEEQKQSEPTQPGVTYQEVTAVTDYLDELEALLGLGDANGYSFRPTRHSYQKARRYLRDASDTMGHVFPRPSFAPDGEGGIDIEWTRNDRQVTLSCRAGANEQDHIYWQEGGEYDANEASLSVLQNKLDWLNDA